MAMGDEFRFPEPAIHRIQYFLTSKEAARTTILSSSWRSAWLCRPNLVFDQTDFHRDYGCHHDGLEQYMEFAMKTMRRYEESNLKIKTISVRNECVGRHCCHPFPDFFPESEMIAMAMKLGAKHLSVRSDNSLICLPDYSFGSGKPDVSIPHYSSLLESLSLHGVHIQNPDTISHILESCPSIRTLSLSRVFLRGASQGYDNHDYDGLIKPHRLTSLVMKCDYFDTLFLSDLSSSFPSLKELTLKMHDDSLLGEEEVLISSQSLERLNVILPRNTRHWSPVGCSKQHSRRVNFDVPSIRKFTYKGSAIPSLSFSSTSRGWESCVSIRHHRSLGASWFRRLGKLLTKMRRSRMSLSLNVSCTKSFDYKVGCIQGLPIIEIENLDIDFMGLPSLSCYALWDGLFRICHPKMITHAAEHFPWSANNIDVLGQTLLQGLTVRVSTPAQFLYGLNDLKEARAQIFDEHVSIWRDVALNALIDDPTTPQDGGKYRFMKTTRHGHIYHFTTPQDSRKYRFQLCWQPCHIVSHVSSASTKYKAHANQRRRRVDKFEVGDFVWAVLTKYRLRFPDDVHSKLPTRKIGPVEIVEKINSKAYRLKLPSHVSSVDVFNVKHLMPYEDDSSSSDEAVRGSRVNLLSPGGNDAAQIALQFMEKRDHMKHLC